MNCGNCGHELSDHDWTFRTCSQERYGSMPYAKRCESECRRMQYDTTDWPGPPDDENPWRFNDRGPV